MSFLRAAAVQKVIRLSAPGCWDHPVRRKPGISISKLSA